MLFACLDWKRGVALIELLVLLACLTGLAAGANAAVVINEFMASNGTTLADEDGDFEDWIELHHTGDAPINLLGHGLSDNPGAPFKWILPHVTLEPGGYLLIWASGKDRRDPQGALHTNFAIASAGEALLLTRPDGVVADTVPPRALPRDVSLGRSPDGNGAWYYFDAPTPAAPNTSAAFIGILPRPSFSHPAGFHHEPFELTVEAVPSHVMIRYSTDGAPVTPTSPLFPASLAIQDRTHEPNKVSAINTVADVDVWTAPSGPVFKGTSLRARAFARHWLASQEAVATYFVHPKGRLRYPMAVVSLMVDEADFFDPERGIYVAGDLYDGEDWLTGNFMQRGRAWERPIHFELFGVDGGLDLATALGARIHGGWSRRYAQKSLRLYARSSYQTPGLIEHPIFPEALRDDGEPLDQFKRFLLRNLGNDWDDALLRDPFMQSLLEGMPRFEVQAAVPTVVFLNGEFWGLHNLRERYDRHYFNLKYGINSDEVVIVASNASLNTGAPGDEQDYLDLRDYAEAHDLGDPQHYAYVAERMDLDNYATYYAANIYFGNTDWPHNNIKFWRYKGTEQTGAWWQDGRWRWLLFDLDQGFERFSYMARVNTDFIAIASAPLNPRTQAAWPNILFRALLDSPEFQRRFVNKMADLLNGPFRPPRVGARLTQHQARIEPVIQEQLDRWNTSNQPMWHWRNRVNAMHTYASRRPGLVREHILTNFGLSGMATLALHRDGPGHVRVNSLELRAGAPGMMEPIYPWSGIYFRGVPLEVEAVPWPGHRFVGWLGDVQGATRTLTLDLQGNRTLRAVFERDESADEPVYPPAHVLREGPYRFLEWASDHPEGVFPESMVFLQADTSDPGPTTPLETPYHVPLDEYHEDDLDSLGYPYNNTRRTRLEGLGREGLAFINTGRERDLGAAVLALDTRDLASAFVWFTAQTLAHNERTYGVRLQYRVGGDPAARFTDVEIDGSPVVFESSASTTGAVRMGPIALPEHLLNRPYVQLAWRYHHVAGDSGPRDMIRLDDIEVIGKALPALPVSGVIVY